MEVNYMLAYGSAEASLRLLWKFGLLEILLPIQVLLFGMYFICYLLIKKQQPKFELILQASYFVCTGFRRHDTRSNMLLVNMIV